jgi:hypothetical protein
MSQPPATTRPRSTRDAPGRQGRVDVDHAERVRQAGGLAPAGSGGGAQEGQRTSVPGDEQGPVELGQVDPPQESGDGRQRRVVDRFQAAAQFASPRAAEDAGVAQSRQADVGGEDGLGLEARHDEGPAGPLRPAPATLRAGTQQGASLDEQRRQLVDGVAADGRLHRPDVGGARRADAHRLDRDGQLASDQQGQGAVHVLAHLHAWTPEKHRSVLVCLQPGTGIVERRRGALGDRRQQAAARRADRDHPCQPGASSHHRAGAASAAARWIAARMRT